MSILRPSVKQLQERPTAEVLIIGGGINGIATFRELALQGVDVVLVERNDFVSGASAASSHMVHGGVRYLENGEFRLVKEAVQERNRLIRNAPHYVTPLLTTIPIFKTFSGILAAPFRLLFSHGRGKPRERGALLIKVGLLIYDTFSRGGGRVPRHRFHGRERSLRDLPQLNPDIKYTASYCDASMRTPERLGLDVLYDGVAAGAASTRDGSATARAVNYVSVVGFSQEGNASPSSQQERGSVVLRDELSGEEFSLSARLLINASGPWADLTNKLLGQPTKYMGGTKGSHIVLNHPQLLEATGGREIFFEHSDGRVVLIYPLNDRILVGTTDINADPKEQPVCTDAEIDYFLELVRHVFPAIPVDRSQIVYTFSGVRPLPQHDATTPGFVSRDYRIEQGWVGGVHSLSLVGGKWTTFRALAEHLGDTALDIVGLPRKVSTRNTAIGGGVGFPRDRASRRIWCSRHANGHDLEFVELLLNRYGTQAAELLSQLPQKTHALISTPLYSTEELAHLATREDVVHLDDVVLRRTSLAFSGGLTREALEEVAAAIAPVMNWTARVQRHEVDRLQQILKDAHRIELDGSGLSPIRPSS